MSAQISALLVWALSVPIRFYRAVVSPWLPAACRYEPSCSQYALEALATHGPVRGLWLGVTRLARCHPWGGFGPDPVPQVRCAHHSHASVGG
jgi:putative membrane protein insertion efficiency factor